jgi:hypothetical protein
VYFAPDMGLTKSWLTGIEVSGRMRYTNITSYLLHGCYSEALAPLQTLLFLSPSYSTLEKKEIAGTCCYLGPLTHRIFFG